ncbi:hypothetical protein [Paraburkholderia sediminicola]|uniref:hypothetical protein n=1 Tax=Paraburkholderia sediminicola TaxID=458836 RepID=UPI0038BD5418
MSQNTSLAVSSNEAKGGRPCKSGFLGVSFDNNARKWTAKVKLTNGKRKHVGLYPTAQEAAAARAAFIATHGTANPRAKAATVTSGEAA